MRKSRFTEEQIIKMLKEHAAGLSAGAGARYGLRLTLAFHRLSGRCAVVAFYEWQRDAIGEPQRRGGCTGVNETK